MPGPNGFDSIIVGYYRGDDLTYGRERGKLKFGEKEKGQLRDTSGPQQTDGINKPRHGLYQPRPSIPLP
jgi:hypothetical protein